MILIKVRIDCDLDILITSLYKITKTNNKKKKNVN